MTKSDEFETVWAIKDEISFKLLTVPYIFYYAFIRGTKFKAGTVISAYVLGLYTCNR